MKRFQDLEKQLTGNKSIDNGIRASLKYQYSNEFVKRLNINIKLHGSLPKNQQVIYTANHKSILDTLIIEKLVYEETNSYGDWVAKKELFDTFIIGDFYRSIGCIRLDREKSSSMLSFFKETKRRVKEDNKNNIFIFPEGTRNKKNGILSFKEGFNKISKMTGLPIIPIYIKQNTADILNRSKNEAIDIDVFIGKDTDASFLYDKYKIVEKSMETPYKLEPK